MEKRILKPASLNNILSESFQFIKQNFFKLFSFNAILFVALTAVILAVFIPIAIICENKLPTSFSLDNMSIFIILAIFIIQLFAIFVSLIQGGMAFAFEMFCKNENFKIKSMFSNSFKKFRSIYPKLLIIMVISFIIIIPLFFQAITLNIYHSQPSFEVMLSFMLIYGITTLALLAVSLFSMFVPYIAAFRNHSIVNTFKFSFKIMFDKYHWIKYIGYTLLFSIIISFAFGLIMMPLSIFFTLFLGITTLIDSSFILLFISMVLFAIVISILAIVCEVFQMSFNMTAFSLMEKETFKE